MSISYADALSQYQQYAQAGLTLDITRGKPSSEQLDLSADLLSAVTGANYTTPSGVDVRNYGGLEGLIELRELFSEVMGIPVSNLLVQDNSSLTLMGLTLQFHVLFNAVGSDAAWATGPKKILCPVPGYDRHFGLAEHLGFELIPVPMDEHGPDLETVSELVKDPAVKAMWVVPVYSNPSGYTISTQRAQELAALNTAAQDFRLLWDNAYAVHQLSGERPPALPILDWCAKAGHPDRVWIYASTSKITFAGGGVSLIASSEANIEWFKSHLSAMSIGPDKINQLRHLRFFKDAAGLLAHMEKHAQILAPKFKAVEDTLSQELGDSGQASWTTPLGGYFITLTVTPGTASRVVELAAEAGVKLTPAGATHPYGNDPEDAVIRIAPSMPALPEVEEATRVLAACVRLAAAEKATGQLS